MVILYSLLVILYSFFNLILQPYYLMKSTKPTPTEIDAGALLKNYIDRHRIYKSALDRSLNKSKGSVIKYQKHASLQSAVLIAMSHALKHNFLADLAALLPDSYTTTEPKDNRQEQRIAELEAQLTIVQAEKSVLLEALKKG